MYRTDFYREINILRTSCHKKEGDEREKERERERERERGERERERERGNPLLPP